MTITIVNPFTWVKNKIVAIWQYSRTLVLNGVGAVAMFAPDILGYFTSFDFDAVFKHEVAVVIGLIITALNAYVRIYLTVAPVGASANAKVAAVNAVADVHEEEAKLAAAPVVVAGEAQSPKA